MTTDDSFIPRVTERVKPIAEQLMERLEVAELSNKDTIAITTALSKAASAGIHLGVVETIAQAAQQNVVIDHWWGPPDESDLWAELYGDDE
jgi:transcription antitermination factor NusA-like protein